MAVKRKQMDYKNIQTMKIEELIEICKERNELDFLFSITKVIAESDSISEGWAYCTEYTRELFNNAEKDTDNEYEDYLHYGGIEVYRLYLQKVITNS